MDEKGVSVDAGVVDEDVHPAELTGRHRHRFRRCRLQCDIADHHRGAPGQSRIVSAVSSSLAPRRPTRTTSAPSRANARAVEAPSPVPAPVTMATFPLSCPMLRSSSPLENVDNCQSETLSPPATVSSSPGQTGTAVALPAPTIAPALVVYDLGRYPQVRREAQEHDDVGYVFGLQNTLQQVGQRAVSQTARSRPVSSPKAPIV